MKTTMIILSVTALLLLVGSFTAHAVASPRHGGWGGQCQRHGADKRGEAFGHLGRGCERLGRLISHLDDLTPQQSDQIRDIFKTHTADMIDAAWPMFQAKRELKRAAKDETVGEAEVRAAADKLGDAIADLAVIRARLHREVMAVLTPQQQEQLKQMRHKRKGYRCERGHEHDEDQD